MMQTDMNQSINQTSVKTHNSVSYVGN